MSTVKATYIQHPSAGAPAVELTAAGGLWLGGGKILQIVRATDSTLRSTTSTSLVDATGMTVTITPQKSNSAILLILSALSQTIGNTYHDIAITDNSNNVLTSRFAGFSSGTSGITGVNYPITVIAYDTPGTTSETTYKIRHATGNAAITVRFNNAGTGTKSEFYALEISA